MNKLFLSRLLYKEECIRKAIIDYQNLTTISLIKENQYFVCVFEKCKYNIDLTVHEFENYLISLCAKGL